MKEIERQATGWEMIFSKEISDKKKSHWIYKENSKPSIKKLAFWLQQTDSFSREVVKWDIKMANVDMKLYTKSFLWGN